MTDLRTMLDTHVTQGTIAGAVALVAGGGRLRGRRAIPRPAGPTPPAVMRDFWSAGASPPHGS